jgi:hypothetical protein
VLDLAVFEERGGLGARIRARKAALAAPPLRRIERSCR